MWGDGTPYVSKVASLFAPEIEQQINDGYKMYHDTNAEDPVVDLDQIKAYLDEFKNEQQNLPTKPIFPER